MIKIKRNRINQNLLKEILKYDDEVGRLRWTISKCGIKLGSIAGNVNKVSGYRRISINGISYYEHRLIWIYHNGYDSENFIDHIDGNRSNNRIENLQELTHYCNTQKKRNNTSGHTGVTWYKARRLEGGQGRRNKA